MAVLVDTSMLLALAFARDANHAAASRALHLLHQESSIVAAPVLTELFYMTMVRISYPRAIQVFARTRAAFEIQALTEPDMLRMQQIMEQYQDAAFDFTDTAIMALSERLRITRVCTFDRRDFSIFRPLHCDYLELLP
jgi:predicted nucleic acid-binding protein